MEALFCRRQHVAVVGSTLCPPILVDATLVAAWVFACVDRAQSACDWASTVEEADFTRSPWSASCAKTSLLVTPNSFASSCTRALPAIEYAAANANH